jgi:hypothetical protein
MSVTGANASCPKRAFFFFVALILMFEALPLAAQTTSAGTQSTSEVYQFPQWAKDLRRAEIVGFGTIPFTWLVATTFIDVSRTIAHNGDQKYWPWPLKPAGAPAMSSDEFIVSIGVAFGVSAAIAFLDYFINRSRRNKVELEQIRNPPREPIIRRVPATETGEPKTAGNVRNTGIEDSE